MTNVEKLASIKISLNIIDDSEDEKLNNYLSLAETEIINWLYSLVGIPETPTFPPKYDVVQIFAVVTAYTIEGAEGESTHIENGIHRKFEYDTMVSYIRSHVYPYARL